MILCSDFRDALRRFCEPIDIVFLDPPYDSGFLTDALKEISDGGMGELERRRRRRGRTCGGRISAGDVVRETDEGARVKKYGKIGITVYENAAEAEAEE